MENNCNRKDKVIENEVPCSCGSSMCSYGQVCFLNENGKSLFQAGFCFTPDKNYIHCNTLAPEFDTSVNRISVSVTNSAELEIKADITDRAKSSGEKLSGKVFGDMVLENATSSDGKNFKCSPFKKDDFDISRKVLLEGRIVSGSTAATIRRYYTEGKISIGPNKVPGQSYCLKISLYDEAGNVRQALPIVLKVTKDGSIEFLTSSSNVNNFDVSGANLLGVEGLSVS